MKRDGALPALAILLLVPALPVAGWITAPLLPTTPRGYYAVALVLCLLFLVGTMPVRRGGVLRVATCALAALPFLAFAVLAQGGGPGALTLPTAGWFAVLALAAVASLGGSRRTVLAACIAVLVGGGAVLASADLRLLPAAWNPAAHPLPPVAYAVGAAGAHPDASERGLREAAPVRLPPDRSPALGEGPGPWWVRAASGRFAGPRPVVLVLDGADDGDRATRPVGDRPLTRIAGGGLDFRHALDLTAFDVLLVREAAWRLDDRYAREKAEAVAGFVRGGGLLIGPAPDNAWPPHLGRLLRGSGRSRERGPGGVRCLGLGRVVRAATGEDAQAALDARLWVPEVEALLAHPTRTPPVPAGWAPWQDDRGGRRPQGLLLAVFAAALAAFAWVVRTPAARFLVVLLASATVCAGLAWLSPPDPGFRVHGAVLELGGRGGRRFEAVLISAGPGGFEAPVRWSGGGVVSVHGGELTPDGGVRVGPGRRAWVVRETLGVGARPRRDVEDRRSAAVAALLVGDAAPERLRFGRLEALPVRVPGAGAVPAATLLYRPPAP